MSATNKSDRTFSLIRFKKQCYYPPVSVDFTPITRPNLGSLSIMPKFNLDGNFFTPAFVNPYQYYRPAHDSIKVIDEQKQKFFKQIPKGVDQPTNKEIQFNPRDNYFCSICRMHFECYWNHVNSKIHSTKIKSNRSNKYILNLCSQISKKRKIQMKKNNKKEKSESKKKTKTIKKQRKEKPKKQQYKKQDFIITLPKELFEKDILLGGCNSTNGMISWLSLQQKQ